MSPFVPRRPTWSASIDTIDPSLPSADLELFELVGTQLDRFHALGPFERRDPAFRILDALASWARAWGGQGSPYERLLQQLWNPVQGWLTSDFVDLFPGEAATIATLPVPRFLTLQSLRSSAALILYHRPSWGLGAAMLAPNQDETAATWGLIHGLEAKLTAGWHGPEMNAWILGGKVGTDEPRHERIREALAQARIPEARIESPWSPRAEDESPIHVVFDRTEGRARPFHPTFDPVYFNIRKRLDREACRVNALKERPILLWPFEEF